MYVEFQAIGLSFEATLNLSRGRSATYYEPAEYPEIEILTLTCEGNEAMFLLDSKFAEDIHEAAHIAACEEAEQERIDALEARADYQREEMTTL